MESSQQPLKSPKAKSTQVANNLFVTVQAIFNFFSSSPPRWATLAFSEDFAGKIRKKVLKKICPTRWEARHESVSALKQRYIDVLKSLINISLTSKKSDERSEAQSLQKKNGIFSIRVDVECLGKHITTTSWCFKNVTTTIYESTKCMRQIKRCLLFNKLIEK